MIRQKIKNLRLGPIANQKQIIYQGEKYDSSIKLAEHLGINVDRIYRRIRNGKPLTKGSDDFVDHTF